MNLLKYLIFIFGLFLLSNCTENQREKKESGSANGGTIENESKPSVPQKNIIIYGSMECNNCHDFRRKLESKGISYEFRDVDENDSYFSELQKLIRSINYQGYVSYPVIDIEWEIYVNPEFREVENKMYSDQ